MYLTYYGLSKEPFHITPDPEFLFLTESHKQALGSLIYGIEKRKGFVVITGGIGVGKTTVVRFYLERWRNPRLKIVYIFNPSMTFGQLVKTLCQELGFPTKSEDVHEIINDLHMALIAQYQSGMNVALIVDEAQILPVEVLENLRLLSNLETAKDKLLQIVFIGQPEFDRNIDRDDMRQLWQRIAMRTSIEPLSREESLSYIEHRLAKAGIQEGEVFSKGALETIVKEAEGIPRTLNILCDNALITGFGYQVKPVTASVAKEVISDFRKRKLSSPRLRPAFALLFLAVLLAVASYVFFTKGPSDFFPPQRQISRGTPPEQGVAPKAAQKPALSPPSAVPLRKESTDFTRERDNIVRVMEKGDNLTRLIKDVYAITDSEVRDGKWIELIKKSNPQIRDVNRIPVGSEIVFPPLPEKENKGDER